VNRLANNQYPRITFGIIVLNGEPFTRYCLRSLYPFAHEIIVVEGGSEAAHLVTTPDGHSIDGTLETLLKFKREEDPENKVQIIYRQGFWPGKDAFGGSRTQQSQAYAEKATGDYLWQIDIDEFYKTDDILAVIEMLFKDPTITAVSFMTHTFWGSRNYIADCWALRRGAAEFHRLFKWGPHYQYVTHEPPSVIDGHGKELHTLNWMRGEHLAKKGVYMYHYSLLFPWQVKQKTLLYQNERPDNCSEIVNWAENNYFQLKNPYRVHNLYKSPSWLERFHGSHPPEIIRMMEEIDRGITPAEIRQTEDVEHLLSAWWYPFGITILKLVNPIDHGIYRIRVQLGRFKRQLIKCFSTKR
jgi:glycosyltransferase involved in cell wall biosynthesis